MHPSFHVYSGFYPKSCPSVLASPESFFKSRLFTQYLIYLPLLNNLLSASVHHPERKGSEESRLGGTSLGGARAPPRPGRVRWGPLTVFSVLQSRHLRLPRGHSSNQRSLESRGGLARRKGPYKLKPVGVKTRASPDRTCQLQVKGRGGMARSQS